MCDEHDEFGEDATPDYDVYEQNQVFLDSVADREEENDTHEFATKEEALAWMAEAVADEDCVDNERFAFCDNDAEVFLYDDARDSGCCGSSDWDILVAGKRAMMGCNYGH